MEPPKYLTNESILEKLESVLKKMFYRKLLTLPFKVKEKSVGAIRLD